MIESIFLEASALVIVTDPMKLDGIKEPIARHCEKIKKQFLFLNLKSSEQINSQWDSIEINNETGEARVVSGPIQSLFEKGGVLIINLDLTATVMHTSLNSLLEDTPYFKGRKIDSDIKVIGLVSAPRLASFTGAGGVFLSRFKRHIFWDDDTLLTDSPFQKLISSKPVPSEQEAIDVRYGVDWQTRLLGEPKYRPNAAKAYQYEDGALLSAKSPVISLRNIPEEDSEFMEFIDQSVLSKGLFVNGTDHKIDDLSFQLQKPDDRLTQVRANIKSSKDLESDRTCFPLVADNFNELFELCHFDSKTENIYPVKGWSSNATYDSIRIVGPLSRAQWLRLFYEEKLELPVFLDDDIRLPIDYKSLGAASPTPYKYPKRTSISMGKAPTFPPPKGLEGNAVFYCDDTGAAEIFLESLHSGLTKQNESKYEDQKDEEKKDEDEKDADFYVVNVTADMQIDDLFFSIRSVKGTKRYLWKSLLPMQTLLSKGTLVLKHASVNPSLVNQLAGLLYTKSFYDGTQKVDINGRIWLLETGTGTGPHVLPVLDKLPTQYRLTESGSLQTYRRLMMNLPVDMSSQTCDRVAEILDPVLKAARGLPKPSTPGLYPEEFACSFYQFSAICAEMTQRSSSGTRVTEKDFIDCISQKLLAPYQFAPSVHGYLMVCLKIATSERNIEDITLERLPVDGATLARLLEKTVDILTFEGELWPFLATIGASRLGVIFKRLATDAFPLPPYILNDDIKSQLNQLVRYIISKSTYLKGAYSEICHVNKLPCDPPEQLGEFPKVSWEEPSRASEFNWKNSVSSCAQVLKTAKTPALFIQGESGTGKTTSITSQAIFKEIGQATPAFSDAEPQEEIDETKDDEKGESLLEHSIIGPFTLSADSQFKDFAPQIRKWINSKSAIIVFDEANLAGSGFWNWAEGLMNQRQPHIWLDGERHLINPATHKVIGLGNRGVLVGRQQCPALRNCFVTVCFYPLERRFIEQTVLTTELLSSLALKPDIFLPQLYFYLDTLRALEPEQPITPRDLLAICQHANWLMNTVYKEAKSRFKDKTEKVIFFKAVMDCCFSHLVEERASIDEWFHLHSGFHWNACDDFLNQCAISNEFSEHLKKVKMALTGPSRRYIQQFIRLLAKSESEKNHGKKGLIVSGPSGHGKDRFLQEWLDFSGYENADTCFEKSAKLEDTKQYFLRINVGCFASDLKRKIDYAMQEGIVLILSEANLLPSNILEGYLNDMSGHTVHKNFRVILTINDTSHTGRQKLSKAFINRCTHLVLPAYNRDELIEVATASVTRNISKEGILRSVDEYLDLQSQLRIRRAPQPTPRDLINHCEKLEEDDNKEEFKDGIEDVDGYSLFRSFLDIFPPQIAPPQPDGPKTLLLRIVRMISQRTDFDISFNSIYPYGYFDVSEKMLILPYEKKGQSLPAALLQGLFLRYSSPVPDALEYFSEIILNMEYLRMQEILPQHYTISANYWSIAVGPDSRMIQRLTKQIKNTKGKNVDYVLEAIEYWLSVYFTDNVSFLDDKHSAAVDSLFISGSKKTSITLDNNDFMVVRDTITKILQQQRNRLKTGGFSGENIEIQYYESLLEIYSMITKTFSSRLTPDEKTPTSSLGLKFVSRKVKSAINNMGTIFSGKKSTSDYINTSGVFSTEEQNKPPIGTGERLASNYLPHSYSTTISKKGNCIKLYFEDYSKAHPKIEDEPGTIELFGTTETGVFDQGPCQLFAPRDYMPMNARMVSKGKESDLIFCPVIFDAISGWNVDVKSKNITKIIYDVQPIEDIQSPGKETFKIEKKSKKIDEASLKTHHLELFNQINELKKYEEYGTDKILKILYNIRDYLKENTSYSRKHANYWNEYYTKDGFYGKSALDMLLYLGTGVCYESQNALAYIIHNFAPKIQMRCVGGHFVKHGIIPNEDHGWVEVWLPSKGWIILDATASGFQPVTIAQLNKFYATNTDSKKYYQELTFPVPDDLQEYMLHYAFATADSLRKYPMSETFRSLIISQIENCNDLYIEKWEDRTPIPTLSGGRFDIQRHMRGQIPFVKDTNSLIREKAKTVLLLPEPWIFDSKWKWISFGYPSVFLYTGLIFIDMGFNIMVWTVNGPVKISNPDELFSVESFLHAPGPKDLMDYERSPARPQDIVIVKDIFSGTAWQEIGRRRQKTGSKEGNVILRHVNKDAVDDNYVFYKSYSSGLQKIPKNIEKLALNIDTEEIDLDVLKKFSNLKHLWLMISKPASLPNLPKQLETLIILFACFRENEQSLFSKLSSLKQTKEEARKELLDNKDPFYCYDKNIETLKNCTDLKFLRVNWGPRLLIHNLSENLKETLHGINFSFSAAYFADEDVLDFSEYKNVISYANTFHIVRSSGKWIPPNLVHLTTYTTHTFRNIGSRIHLNSVQPNLRKITLLDADISSFNCFDIRSLRSVNLLAEEDSKLQFRSEATDLRSMIFLINAANSPILSHTNFMGAGLRPHVSSILANDPETLTKFKNKFDMSIK